MKLRKRFIFNGGTVKINIIDWDDGKPLGYVWFGSRKGIEGGCSHDFTLEPKSAVTLARHILEAHRIKQEIEEAKP